MKEYVSISSGCPVNYGDNLKVDANALNLFWKIIFVHIPEFGYASNFRQNTVKTLIKM
jgi:hypothetical protein